MEISKSVRKVVRNFWKPSKILALFLQIMKTYRENSENFIKCAKYFCNYENLRKKCLNNLGTPAEFSESVWRGCVLYDLKCNRLGNIVV